MNYVSSLTLITQGSSQIVITPIFTTQIYPNNSLTQGELFIVMTIRLFNQHHHGFIGLQCYKVTIAPPITLSREISWNGIMESRKITLNPTFKYACSLFYTWH
jgi:hypothetical protein